MRRARLGTLHRVVDAYSAQYLTGHRSLSRPFLLLIEPEGVRRMRVFARPPLHEFALSCVNVECSIWYIRSLQAYDSRRQP
ncbi:hypothetical protein BURKHO8Y_180065 [Burkholderia sp. 8Y]|nr:hypothetical protein BURKHO8Y_180065 [Burkholderia sp. 8Y]